MRQPRILFCTHDGKGLGHLTRLSRVAVALQKDCACLFLSGHRTIANILPESCEFIHLPSLDSLFPKRAAYWGRKPFLNVTRPEALRFRMALIETAFREFAPDVVLVDHLPLGHHNEIATALASSPARKYLMLRGVLNVPELARAEIFSPESLKTLEESFSRILVASDPAVSDLVAEYQGHLPQSVLDKVAHVGYVAPRFDSSQLAAARRDRGLSPEIPWVVCSAGGGMTGETLIEHCRLLVERFPHVAFDLVYGPRSYWKDRGEKKGAANLRILSESWQLPVFHAAADVVICRGGYNTLMEVAMGHAQIICCPYTTVENREQLIHAERLSNHLPLVVASELSEISDLLARALAEWSSKGTTQCSVTLNFKGAENSRRILLEDLGFLEKNNLDSTS